LQDGRRVEDFSIALDSQTRVWITKSTNRRTKERKRSENHKRGTAQLKMERKRKATK
jgi:hypothetical protein